MEASKPCPSMKTVMVLQQQPVFRGAAVPRSTPPALHSNLSIARRFEHLPEFCSTKYRQPRQRDIEEQGRRRSFGFAGVDGAPGGRPVPQGFLRPRLWFELFQWRVRQYVERSQARTLWARIR